MRKFWGKWYDVVGAILLVVVLPITLTFARYPDLLEAHSAIIKAPKKIQGEDPCARPTMRCVELTGQVVLEAVIGKDGKIKEVKVIKSDNPKLNDPAIEAVKKWEYEPTKLNGVAVEVVMEITVNFKSSKPEQKKK